MIPPTSRRSRSGALVSRRTFVRGLVASGGAVAVGGLAAACGGDDGGGSDGGAAGEVTFGSNYSDAVPKQALAKALSDFEKEAGMTVVINTVEHNTFQEQINNYLQGNPDDVFAWFAGYRMQFFADRGLCTPINDVWETIGSEMSEAFKAQSTGLDGNQYFVPFYYYPWGVFYRKSVFEENGYEIPVTWDEYLALCGQMHADGLTPIAMGDQDGWPAMGTFDYLNMRINGYDFHISLMKGEEAWDGPEVRDVFAHWQELIPHTQEGATGRIWQDAVTTLANKESGLIVHGTGQVGPVFQEHSQEAYDDLDFFAFPEITPEFGQDAIEAPIDGFMLSSSPVNEEGAKELLTFLGGADAQETYLATDPNNVACNNTADTSKYNALQKKSVELVSGAQDISQFLDRDTRPDFASTVMIPSLQEFLNNPDDVEGLTQRIEEQKQSIFVG
jgi:multiple sugar transport system substrate-binding protein